MQVRSAVFRGFTLVSLLGLVGLSGQGWAQTSPQLVFADVPVRLGPAGNGWSSIAADHHGNRYVTELWRHWIRKITPTGEVTTLAGAPGESGSRDGQGVDARFSIPLGLLTLAADAHGNIFVADSDNHTIRKITPAGEVTTIAGQAGVYGAVDGVGAEARFIYPRAITVDPWGTVYVADHSAIRTVSLDGKVGTVAGSMTSVITARGPDGLTKFYYVAALAVDRDRNVYIASFDDTVRKLSPAGQMTILAGRSSQHGSSDGQGEEARFYFSTNFTFDDFLSMGLAVDGSGNVWVCDPGSQVIRRITPSGSVSSVGREARMMRPSGLAIDAAGSFHVVDLGIANRLLSAVVSSPFAVDAVPQSLTIARGGSAVFTVSASGAGLTYQWTKDGVPLAGATQPSLIIPAAESGDAGTYRWSVSDFHRTEAGGEASLAVAESGGGGRLLNVSVRSDAVNAARTLLVGTTIAGSSPFDTMPVLLRAVGPSLHRFGLRGYLEDPTLTVRRAGSVVAANDDWGGVLPVAARSVAVGAFPLESPTSRDAAIVTGLVSGGYVLEIAGKGEASGTVLGEWFDATPERQPGAAPPRIVNLSARQQLGANGETLIVGFALGGSTARTLLLRAAGPSLTAFGVTEALPDPWLQLFSGSQLIRENRGWGGEEQLAGISRSVDAFPFMSAYSQDAALLVTLPPGDYTLQVRSRSSAAGVVLAEVYEVP